jgi:hypothetical protein
MKAINLVFALALLHSISATSQTNFYAYHTKINSGEAWEEYSKTGEHADIVVQINEGQIIFHRKSSYLPLWKTHKGEWYFEEIIERDGDGPEQRPDKNNIYSYVRLIHESGDSIVVHWRYFNSFKLGHHAQPVGGNVEFDGVVHEYFTFYPDGKVKRVIRKGTKKLVDWEDVKNRDIILTHLNPNGINQVSHIKAALSKANGTKIKGTEIITGKELAEPAYVWHFDEGLKERNYTELDLTLESVSGNKCKVSGPATVWKKGVSGTALGFDGYNSKVTAPALHFSEVAEGGWTLEAWVTPGAYSICEWTAIAHQSVWEADIRDNIFQTHNWGPMQLGEKIKKGFFLGIDEFGHPGAFVVIGENTYHVKSFEKLPLYKWSHVAVSLSNEGMLYLFVNGKLSNFRNFSGVFEPADVDFVIGKNDESIGYVSQHVVRTYSTFPSPLGFDGLIDEVKFYNEILGYEEMGPIYSQFKPENLDADLERRHLPGMVGDSEQFGAQYTKLKYHDLWDNMWREADHPDIVVKFDLMPTSVVFWRGCRSPGWVTEKNKWLSDQSTELTDWHWENPDEGAQSCCEHMSDYQARHSHVRIIENSPARTIIHWRYASVDVLYKHPNACKNEGGYGVWTDEYITIYPDGVGIRTVEQHGAKDFYFGDEAEAGKIDFHDTQFLSEAGTRPEDNIKPKSLTIINSKEEKTSLDWSEGHPSGEFDAQLVTINFKSDYKVFEIFPPGANFNVWAAGEKTSYSKYSAWNHYPVTQAPCDGRFCVAPDRLTHSALGVADNLTENGNMLIYGLTNKPAEELIPLAKSWNYPPKLEIKQGGDSQGYDKGQRAYIIQGNGRKLIYEMNAEGEKPLVNPCFLIKGWGNEAVVSVNGVRLSNGKCRQGLIRDTNGDLQLVVWLMLEEMKKTEIKLEQL